jgi:integrase
MPLGKQAKVLTKGQVEAALAYVENTRHPLRNRVIVLLSVKAGLRAKEIASLTWAMVTAADGKIGRAIHLQDSASKGKSGRIVPLNAALRHALSDWMEASGPDRSEFVIATQRANRTSAQGRS